MIHFRLFIYSMAGSIKEQSAYTDIASLRTVPFQLSLPQHFLYFFPLRNNSLPLFFLQNFFTVQLLVDFFLTQKNIRAFQCNDNDLDPQKNNVMSKFFYRFKNQSQ